MTQDLSSLSREELLDLATQGVSAAGVEDEQKRIEKELAREVARAKAEYDALGDPEEREVARYAEAQRRAASGWRPPPVIPEFIEVPVAKDWSTVSSIAVPGNGQITMDGATEMRKVKNPAWVAMQEQQGPIQTRDTVPPLIPVPASSGNAPSGGCTFDDAVELSALISPKYKVVNLENGNIIVGKGEQK